MLVDMHMLTAAPKNMFIDNTATIRTAMNTGPKKRRKFIDLRNHFLHAQVAKKRPRVVHFPSAQMLADALTKSLKRRLFQYLLREINIRKPMTAPIPKSEATSLTEMLAMGECYSTRYFDPAT